MAEAGEDDGEEDHGEEAVGHSNGLRSGRASADSLTERKTPELGSSGGEKSSDAPAKRPRKTRKESVAAHKVGFRWGWDSIKPNEGLVGLWLVGADF